MQGRVIRARGGFFDVYTTEEIERRCRARGIFKKRGQTVLVGDLVQLVPMGETEGVIEEILPRSTELLRPPVANITQAFVIFSIVEPLIQTYLLDGLLVAVQHAGIRPVIVFTKCDIATDQDKEDLFNQYRLTGFPIFFVSSRKEIGLEDVKEALTGEITVLAGPSGVGKSSLLNALAPHFSLETGGISEKMGRGRHTTRHVSLLSVGENAWVADAPGFSQLSLSVASQDVRLYYPDFFPFAQNCPYRGCLHLQEENCAVQAAVERGDLPAERLTNYQTLVNNKIEQEGRQY